MLPHRTVSTSLAATITRRQRSPFPTLDSAVTTPKTGSKNEENVCHSLHAFIQFSVFTSCMQDLASCDMIGYDTTPQRVLLTVTRHFADVFRVPGVRLAPVLVIDLEDPVVAAAVISTLVVGSGVEAALPIRQT